MMKNLLPWGLIVMAGCASTPEPTAKTGPELAEAIAGRAVQKPVSCVSQRDLGDNKTVDDGDAILFSTRSGTLYVNRPAGGCPSLSFGRTLVTKTTTGSLCRGDIVQVVDLQAGFEHGSCSLGDFVPYRKVQN